MKNETRHALFIKTKNLGDAIILTSAISALPGSYRVHVLCFAECAPLYHGIPGVECVWPVERGLRGLSSLREGLSMLRALRRIEFDLLAQFSDDWRGAILARLLRPRLSVARQTHRRGNFWNRSFKVIAKRVTLRPRHAADSDVDLLRATRLFEGIAPAYLPPLGLLSDPSGQNFIQEMGLKPRQFVVLHLTSRWSFKELPTATSKLLLREMLRRGITVVVSGDAGDAPKLNAVMAGSEGMGIVGCIGYPLAVFASVLSMARALVSIDSFPIHLASALRIPTVAIFGPSDDVVWAPKGVPSGIVAQSESFPCRPCGLDGCAGSKVSECIRTIPFEMIITQLDGLLKQRAAVA